MPGEENTASNMVESGLDVRQYVTDRLGKTAMHETPLRPLALQKVDIISQIGRVSRICAAKCNYDKPRRGVRIIMVCKNPMRPHALRVCRALEVLAGESEGLHNREDLFLIELKMRLASAVRQACHFRAQSRFRVWQTG